jgi:hypothetical protein
MSKKSIKKQLLVISGKRAKKALSVGLDKYLKSIEHTTSISEHAGSIEFSDDEFSAMLQALKEDR